MTPGTRVVDASEIPRPFRAALLRRGIAFWLLARIMILVTAMFIASSTGIEMIRIEDAMRGTNGIIALWTSVIAATITMVDLQRRHEVSLLNNLGVTAWRAVLVGMFPATGIEAALLVLA